MKCAVIGDIGVDYYENLRLLKPGGIAFNFSYNLKKCGVIDVALVSILGNDQSSKDLLSLIKKLGIKSNHIQIRKGNPPKQNILLKNGERKFNGYDCGVLKKWKLRKKDLEFFKKYDVVFIPLSDGMEGTFNLVKKIKGSVKAVDFSQDYEFADFDKKENVITKNAKYFDVIFVGGKKEHQKMVSALSKKYQDKVFVLTLGSDGSIGYYQGKKYIQKAINVKEIVDTTGCGDAFQAGFLATWLKTRNINKSLLAGTNRATSIIKKVGSTPLTLK